MDHPACGVPREGDRIAAPTTTWPVSRHTPTSETSSRRSRLPISTPCRGADAGPRGALVRRPRPRRGRSLARGLPTPRRPASGSLVPSPPDDAARTRTPPPGRRSSGPPRRPSRALFEGRRVVQDRGDEPRHEREAVRLEEVAPSRGEEPVRTELRRASPRDRISESTRSAGIWWPHPGTSQTPQVIGAPATRSARSVTRPPRADGRCSSRERSHATATRIASNASSAVQGLCRRPAATSTNACISAR